MRDLDRAHGRQKRLRGNSSYMVKKAVCLISGGLDSATTAFIAKNQGYEIYALSFNYGQRHNKEINCSKEIARSVNAKDHIIFDINLNKFGGSSLVDKSKKIDENHSLDNIGKTIPSTYVPARNTVFLSIALAYAETINADAIFIGATATDYCLPGSTKIPTGEGIKELTDVAVGDKVLSVGINGLSWKPVVGIYQQNTKDKLLQINANGIKIRCTKEHHMLRYVISKHKPYLNFKHIEVIEANKLKKGDYLPVACSAINVKNKNTRFNPNYLRLISWYVTEGCCHGVNGIAIYQSPEKNKQYFKEIIYNAKKLGFKPNISGDEITIFDKKLRKECEKLGRSACEKHLPQEFLALPNSALKIIFETLVKGDGNIHRRSYWTASNELLQQFWYIANRLGYRCVFLHGKSERRTKGVHYGTGRTKFLGTSFVRIQQIKEVRNNEKLFDLTVEKNHTLLAGDQGLLFISQSGYPDCRPEYIEAFQKMADLATKKGVEGDSIKIKAPLVKMSKAEIIKKGSELNVPFEKTWSCYQGGVQPCGKCDSCLLRLKGFKEAGLKDPLTYEAIPDWYQ